VGGGIKASARIAFGSDESCAGRFSRADSIFQAETNLTYRFAITPTVAIGFCRAAHNGRCAVLGRIILQSEEQEA
jgi:hypothetical protein